MNYTTQFLGDIARLCYDISREHIDAVAGVLRLVRNRGGRVFFLGVGGSAANASHAVNDFRKIAHIESYTPTDNVAELTARINDDNWTESYAGYLRASHFSKNDAVFVLSVGGGTALASSNIIAALNVAHEIGAVILGIVGRDGGWTAQVADAVVLIPTIREEAITPYAESMQAVIWHLLVNHPDLY